MISNENNPVAFHFAKIKGGNYDEYIQKLISYNAVICFDFEDGINDIISPSEKKKRRAKQAMVELICSNKNLTTPGSKKIAIRINSFGSKEFTKDLNLLKQLNQQVEIEYIFLPKINSDEDFLRAIKELERAKIIFYEFIPIIETIDGFKNLKKIIGLDPRIKKIAFGHADFNYNHSYFPFIHQNSPIYWTWISEMIKVIKEEKITFINSPLLFLSNDSLFKFMLDKLEEIYPERWAQTTLNLFQLDLLYQYSNNKGVNVEEKNIDLAPDSKEAIIEIFEKNYKKGIGFSIDKINNRLISPHEYLAAKNS